MKEIPLTRGHVALVDDEDYARVAVYKWFSTPHKYTAYAKRHVWLKGGGQLTISMHRFVLGLESSSVAHIDHINGNGLDNRRENLRPCTRSQNACNGKKRSDNTSGVKGVSWHKRAQKWRARICLNGESRHLGVFPTKETAREAYEIEARKCFGEFTRIE